ncbi:hypothetical protein NDU88_002252 [Pleurodeles waltl]|uniref:Uncharacterized protein n=1 Tax=Pleurodeles waltl TaxID=8319 RepID=A0AAV7W416_PLEWA|nr:hypothetical protein NDU88_002252 [Pleurodeles waltl]
MVAPGKMQEEPTLARLHWPRDHSLMQPLNTSACSTSCRTWRRALIAGPSPGDQEANDNSPAFYRMSAAIPPGVAGGRWGRAADGDSWASLIEDLTGPIRHSCQEVSLQKDYSPPPTTARRPPFTSPSLGS